MGIWDNDKINKLADIKNTFQKHIWPEIKNQTPWETGSNFIRLYKEGDVTPGYSLGISSALSSRGGSGEGPAAPPTPEGTVQGDFSFIPWDGGGATGGGASISRGGGGGGGTSALDAMKRQQMEYADKQRGLVGQRRDAFIEDTERGYGDQLKWLESQGDSARGGADAGRANINTQRDQSIASTEKTAEGEARGMRDVYQDLVLENRRRTRATGAGSSSAFLELTNKLDAQLQSGLAQVGDTKVEKIGLANTIAQQAVGELERTLQSVLAQIDMNKATSLREKDRAITEARMNADEAMLGIDKWLADSSFSIDQAKAATAASYNKANYAQQMTNKQASLLDNITRNLFGMEGAGMTSWDQKQAYLQSQLPNMAGTGMSQLDIGRVFNSLNPMPTQPGNATELFLDDEEAYKRMMALNNPYLQQGGSQGGNANIW